MKSRTQKKYRKFERRTFLPLGVFFSLLTLFYLFVAFMASSVPSSQTYVNAAMAFLSFVMYHLYPQLIAKDERSVLIKDKAMKTSMFITLGLIVVAFGLTVIFGLSATWMFTLLISAIVITMYLSLLYYSKVY
ncbi:hypothetical protein HUG20_08400 [Salicibibacter cibi]|uniref:Permease n=1 Tax=Salicibibacter cibi TaxID=2743001 RepID=A0A7T6ZBC1_9BACI|nr:hypothetical protein [Salicibibacter cibi]QQK79901.1 hypothetical protein HUG20_08400 [Salicibibacter cibi]